MILYEPVGVCALITPWNWPMNQVMLKVAPALAAGLHMVLKTLGTVSAQRHVCWPEMIDAAGFPPGVFNLVNGDGAGVGAASHRAPGRGHGQLHRVDPRWCGDQQGGSGDREARQPRTGGQGGQHHLRRCG